MSDITLRKDKFLVQIIWKPESATFVDQYGNKQHGVFCKGCQVVGLKKDFALYHNYGGARKVIYICDKCLEEMGGDMEGFSRKKNNVASCIASGMRGRR